MKHTYIFKITDPGMTTYVLNSLVSVLRDSVAVSWKYESSFGDINNVQIFSTPMTVAYYAGKANVPTGNVGRAKRNGFMAVQKASDALRNRRLDAIDRKRAEAKEVQSAYTDTFRIDWLQKTGALVNVTSDGYHHVALSIDNHYYDQSYRAVIDRAIRGEQAKQALHSEPIWSVDDAEVSHIDDRQFLKNLSRMTRSSKRSA